MAVTETLEGDPLWVVFIDQQITRRKRYHLVCDPDDVQRYRSMWLGECLAWLETEGVDRYMLIPAEGRTLDLPNRTYVVERLE